MFIRVRSPAQITIGYHVGAGPQQTPRHSGQQIDQIAAECTVSAAEYAQIHMNAPALCAQDLCKFLSLFSRNPAELQSAIHIIIRKPLFRLLPAHSILVQEFLILPPIIYNNGDQRSQQQGVGTRFQSDMHIRHSGSLGQTGIYRNEHPVGILRGFPDNDPGIPHIMCYIGVGTPADKYLTVASLPFNRRKLAANKFAVAPPSSHKFNAHRVKAPLAS